MKYKHVLNEQRNNNSEDLIVQRENKRGKRILVVRFKPILHNTTPINNMVDKELSNDPFGLLRSLK